MKRTILITGANGNLGHEVLNRLYREGHTILATYANHPFDEEQQKKITHAEHVNLMHEGEADTFASRMVKDFPDLNAAVLFGSLGGPIIADQLGLSTSLILFAILRLLAGRGVCTTISD